jgi:4-hydroxymandelate oxidase
VYIAGPPTPSASTGDLRVTAALTRDFEAGLTLPPAHRDALGVYLADLVRPYGLPEPVGPFDGGHAYGEMGEALIRAAVAPDASVDLLVLAYAMPDVRPGRATAAYLSHVCPGVPMAFAICDQATAAPFVGLRVIREYARSGGCARALLLAVEQAALFHDPPEPADIPVGHAGCALLCDATISDGPPLGAVWQCAGVTPDRAVAVLHEKLTGGGTLILGGDLPAGAFDGRFDRVRVAPAGRPLTGVWSELCDEISAGNDRPVVVAHHDARLGYLSVAALGA